MRIKLSAERRDRLMVEIKQFFADALDRDLSDFQTNRLLDFFVLQLGPPIYNQAIQDARGFMQGKLDDLDGEFYEPESA